MLVPVKKNPISLEYVDLGTLSQWGCFKFPGRNVLTSELCLVDVKKKKTVSLKNFFVCIRETSSLNF